MGFMDQLKGMLAGRQGEAGSQAGMLDDLLKLVNDPQSGGLAGLIQKFNEKGLGDLMSSWISTGKNLPVSADQIKNALGSDKIKDLAAKYNLGEHDASKSLADLLPQLIDKLTPNGSVPHQDTLSQGIDMIRKKLLGG
ncbi:MAG TPA: YidB family protein [Syntrophales bacterium]